MARRNDRKPQSPKRIHLSIKRHERRRKEMEAFVRREIKRGSWTR